MSGALTNPDQVETTPVASDPGASGVVTITPGASEQPRQLPLAGLLLVWTAVGLAVALVLLGVGYQSLLPPLRGREAADLLTNHATAVIDLAAQLSMLATFGLLLAATLYSVGGKHHQLGERGRRFVRWAGLAATLWLGTSLLMVPFTAAENNGVGVAVAMGALVPFVAATQPAQAWFFPAAIALVIAVCARTIRSVGATVVLLAVGLVWQLGPVVTGNVSVGADHDFGTDAAIWATLAAVVAIGSAFAAWLTLEDVEDTVRSRRLVWTLALAATVACLARVVVGWYELAGTSPLATGYGVLSTGVVAIWAVLALRGWLGVGRGVRSRGRIAVDLALGIVAVGLQTALAHMAPPRFLVPQGSAQINYLGYEVNTAPTMATLLLPGRPNLLLVTVAVAAIALYLVGVIALRRRGIAWSPLRVAAWVFGWVILLWVGSAGIWAYSGAAFSYHMLTHMTVNMLAPVLIVLGAPITLALRALPARGSDQPPGLRELLTGVLAWKPMEWILHPVVIGLLFISGTYMIYFSGLFEYLMRYHWGHQLMTVHFIIVGLLFFGLIIGPDPNPRELPPVAKLGFLFAAMPFHAFFAVALLSSDGVIAANFYHSLDVAWMTDLVADQKTGGQYTWAMGEIPMFVVVIALVAQWFAQDKREARRRDRAMDEGLDDAHEAYNEMLRKLSERADR